MSSIEQQQLAMVLAIQQEILALLRQTLGVAGMGALLDNADLKAVLKICDKSIYRLRQRRQLKGFKIAGKWYYDSRQVSVLMEQQELDP